MRLTSFKQSPTWVRASKKASGRHDVEASVEQNDQATSARRDVGQVERSRDARTWEFYCDSDARNALTEQAEREEKGSATAAIGLIGKNEKCGGKKKPRDSRQAETEHVTMSESQEQLGPLNQSSRKRKRNQKTPTPKPTVRNPKDGEIHFDTTRALWYSYLKNSIYIFLVSIEKTAPSRKFC